MQGSSVVPGRSRWVRVALHVGVVLGAVVSFGPPVAGALALAGLVARIVAHRRRRQREHRAVASQVATVFELAARSVRSGVDVRSAVAQAAASTGGAGGRLVEVVLHSGGSFAQATYPMGGEGSMTGRVVEVVCDVAGGTIGGGPRALEAGAVLLREHDRRNAEIEAGAAHARASSGLLVGLPVVFAVLAWAVVPAAPKGIAARPMVLVAVVFGIGLDVAGAVWSTHLIRTAQARS
ncbi:MAG: hypothetical protein JST73_05555 [Actinobacteria bacterium]|nr:hypothetical protein [Actinomycetota bacterium]